MTQRYYLMLEIINAVEYLHGVDLVHRDLKPANILVNNDWSAKICDFGLVKSAARDQQGNDPLMTENIATRWYRAP